jgi:hypothetical protein
MMKIYQNVLVVNFLLTLIIDVEGVCAMCTGSVLMIPMSKRKVSVHSILCKNCAENKKPSPKNDSDDAESFFCRGKKNCRSRKKVFHTKPKTMYQYV